MTHSIYDRWAPIIQNQGITGSNDWFSHSQNNFNSQDFPSILPIAMRVASQTVGMDLVSVQPMGSINYNELDRIEKEVKSENRDRKIDSLTEGTEFKEMKVEDHPDYKIEGPTGNLFYLDFKYESGTNSLYLGNCSL